MPNSPNAEKPEHTTTQLSKPSRDRRLDVFRGFAILTIFINHVPGNAFEGFTSRNWGFSDAAEAFVLMSGIAVGLAYTPFFERGEIRKSTYKMWARAFKLYWVHLVVISSCFIILAISISVFQTDEMIRAVTLQPLIETPIKSAIAIPLLSYQIGYVNILPLYVVLLIIAPACMWIAHLNRWLLLIISGGIWLIIHILFYDGIYVNIPNWPQKWGWFLNPFAWQFIFVIGLLGGMSARNGKQISGFNPILYGLALFYAAFSFYWIQMRMGPLPFNDYLPKIVTDFNKGYLSLPRLLHTLSLAYLIIYTKWPHQISKLSIWNPIELIGKHGLPVFAVGTVLSIFIQCFRHIIPNHFWIDLFLLSTGIFIQYCVAVYASHGKTRKNNPGDANGIVG